MKKVLVRGGYSPFAEGLTPELILAQNLIGNNSGNAVYLNSIFGLFQSNGIEAVPDHYRVERGLVTDADFERINEEYDAFIVPLADAFRNAFIPYLKGLTKAFRKLTIPCVVVGVCLRTTFEPKITEEHKFDEAAKEFMAAVLERSEMVGIRGEITGRYLEHLGFVADRDFMVIGCPSVFTFGDDLTQKPLEFSSDMKLSVNFNRGTIHDGMEFLLSQLKRFPRSQYVPQNKHDFELGYLGAPVTLAADLSYPMTSDHWLYRNDRVRMFLHPNTWMDSIAQCDLSIGGRMHGNIVAVLAGTPAVFMPTDGRTRELCEYHCFPHVPMRSVKPDTTLEDVLELVDLGSQLRAHADRLARYQSFLKKNGLPFEISVARKPGLKKFEIHGINDVSREQLIARWVAYHEETVEAKKASSDVRAGREKARAEAQKAKVASLKNENKQIKMENKQLSADLKKCKRTLNRKSVKAVLKLVDGLAK